MFFAICLGNSIAFAASWDLESEASQEDEKIRLLEEYQIDFSRNIALGDTLELDASPILPTLENIFPDQRFSFEWNVFNQSSLTGDKVEITFPNIGRKKFTLNIYSLGREKKLLYSKEESVFVYQAAIPLLIGNSIVDDAVSGVIKRAEDSGVLLYPLPTISEAELDGKVISKNLWDFSLQFKNESDYFVIWGAKEFLLSALNSMNTQKSPFSIRNYVLISSYNSGILKNYLYNSVAGKEFIDTAFIIDEPVFPRVVQNPLQIQALQKDLEQNQYLYTPLSQWVQISHVLFISKFINSLANKGVPTSDIYIFLLLPILLSLVAFGKHFIGISTLGSIIPVFLSILFIKVWVVFMLVLMILLVIVNIIVSGFLNQYTLLYSPKVAFLTILNLVIFMLIYNIFGFQHIVNVSIPAYGVMYLALFFIIAEKLITVISSKEFREYEKSLSGTLIIAIIGFLIYHINPFMVFLTAYPEILLLLIPFNFFLGKFTGLRITEYIRFREVIKNVEEE